MNEKGKYTELMNQIKATQPKISDPQRLSSETMQRIEKLPQKKDNNKRLTLVSWTSSIAASLLIGLFVFEQFAVPTRSKFISYATPSDYIFYISEINNMKKQTTMNDFKHLLNSKIDRQKKQQTLNLIINKYKTL